MSSYDLIPDEAYDNLPEEDSAKFVTLVRIAQGNLQRLMDASNAREFDDELRSQFMAIIGGIAKALKIEGLEQENASFEYPDYTRFQVKLAGIVAMVRLQGDLISHPHSVELERVTKGKIRQEIEQLRVYIGDADLSSLKRQALNDKLDEFIAELDKRRLSFARTMAIAASIMGVLGGSSAALANAPKIPAGINFIISLIGIDKDHEDAERLRLAPPPLLIESKGSITNSSDLLDDDVPF